MIEPSPTDLALATLLRDFNKTKGVAISNAAWGAPTANDLKAKSVSDSLPDSKPSAKFCPDNGTYPAPNAPAYAPRLKVNPFNPS